MMNWKDVQVRTDRQVWNTQNNASLGLSNYLPKRSNQNTSLQTQGYYGTTNYSLHQNIVSAGYIRVIAAPYLTDQSAFQKNIFSTPLSVFYPVCLPISHPSGYFGRVERIKNPEVQLGRFSTFKPNGHVVIQHDGYSRYIPEIAERFPQVLPSAKPHLHPEGQMVQRQPFGVQHLRSGGWQPFVNPDYSPANEAMKVSLMDSVRIDYYEI